MSEPDQRPERPGLPRLTVTNLPYLILAALAVISISSRLFLALQ